MCVRACVCVCVCVSVSVYVCVGFGLFYAKLTRTVNSGRNALSKVMGRCIVVVVGGWVVEI